MKTIYLDTNVIVDMMKEDRKYNFELNEKYKILASQFIFPYSPAHMEELAGIKVKEKEKEKADIYIEKQKKFIAKISKNYEFLSPNGEIILIEEHPSVCFKRVVDLYDLTLFAEMNAKFTQSWRDIQSYKDFFSNSDNLIDLKYLLSKIQPLLEKDELFIRQANRFNNFINIFEKKYQDLKNGLPIPSDTLFFQNIQTKYNINKKKLGDIRPELIFKEKNVLNYMKNGYSPINMSIRYKDIQKSHRTIELLISELLYRLEEIGFKGEKRNKFRSRLHDNAHAIYATKANYFIIGDKLFRNKVKAVYSHLEVPTKVLSVEEFLEYQF